MKKLFFSIFSLLSFFSFAEAQTIPQKDWLLRVQMGITASRLGREQYIHLKEWFQRARYGEIKNKAFPLASAGLELNYKRLSLLAEGQLEIPTRMDITEYSGYRLNLLAGVQMIKFLDFDLSFLAGVSYNLHQLLLYKNNYVATFEQSFAPAYNNATTYVIKGLCADFSLQTRYQNPRFDVIMRMGVRVSPSQTWLLDDYALAQAPQDQMNYFYTSLIFTPFKVFLGRK